MLSVILPPVFFVVLLVIGAYKFVTDPKSTAEGFAAGLVVLTIGTVVLYELLSAYGF